MHFFSPAQVMPLLEIVRTSETADDVARTAMQLRSAPEDRRARRQLLWLRREPDDLRIPAPGRIPRRGRRHARGRRQGAEGARHAYGAVRDVRHGRPRRRLAHPQDRAALRDTARRYSVSTTSSARRGGSARRRKRAGTTTATRPRPAGQSRPCPACRGGAQAGGHRAARHLR